MYFSIIPVLCWPSNWCSFGKGLTWILLPFLSSHWRHNWQGTRQETKGHLTNPEELKMPLSMPTLCLQPADQALACWVAHANRLEHGSEELNGSRIHFPTWSCSLLTCSLISHLWLVLCSWYLVSDTTHPGEPWLLPLLLFAPTPKLPHLLLDIRKQPSLSLIVPGTLPQPTWPMWPMYSPGCLNTQWRRFERKSRLRLRHM